MVTPEKENQTTNKKTVDPAQYLHQTAMGLLDRFTCGGFCASATDFQEYDQDYVDQCFSPEAAPKPTPTWSQDDIDDNSLLAAARTAAEGLSFDDPYSPVNHQLETVITPSTDLHRKSLEQSRNSNSQQQQQHNFIFLDRNVSSPPAAQQRQPGNPHEHHVFRALDRKLSSRTPSTSVSSSPSHHRQQHDAPVPSIQSSQTFDEDDTTTCCHDDDDDDVATYATPTHSNCTLTTSSTATTASCSPGEFTPTRSVPNSLGKLRAAKQRAREHRAAALQSGRGGSAFDRHRYHQHRRNGSKTQQLILPELAVLHKTQGYEC